MTNAIASIKNWLDAGLGFLYPEVCQLCREGRAASEQGYVCESCRAEARLIAPPFCRRCGYPYEGAITTSFECGNCHEMDLEFASARSAVVARDKVLDAIHRYKYQRAIWLEPFLSGFLIAQAKPELEREKWDWIVPIPLHATRLREREFNQAERLARRLSAATGIAVHTRLLKRVVATRTQTQLTREARLANVRNAFAPWPEARLNGEQIVLLDDVFTTGATANACARTLRQLGAGKVCVWTVARGI
jgi:competence protein ComFC